MRTHDTRQYGGELGAETELFISPESQLCDEMLNFCG